MKSDGTEPQTSGPWRLAFLEPGFRRTSTITRGWTRRSVRSPSRARTPRPKRIMKCSTCVLPSVSPDNRQVAYFESGSLKIKDLASQTLVAECASAVRMTWGVTRLVSDRPRSLPGRRQPGAAEDRPVALRSDQKRVFAESSTARLRGLLVSAGQRSWPFAWGRRTPRFGPPISTPRCPPSRPLARVGRSGNTTARSPPCTPGESKPTLWMPTPTSSVHSSITTCIKSGKSVPT